MTARLKHIVTDGGHAIITGRDGDVIQRCEDEPIHIPGAFQGFGLLIALAEEDGKFVVRIVSKNSKKIMGYSPKQLFALESFTDILSEEQADNLLDHVNFVRDEDSNAATNGPEVFTLSIRHSGKSDVHRLIEAIQEPHLLDSARRSSAERNHTSRTRLETGYSYDGRHVSPMRNHWRNLERSQELPITSNLPAPIPQSQESLENDPV
jgi:hypothetical protein